MQLSGGRDDLDLTDDVNDGVAAEHLSRDCQWMSKKKDYNK